VHILKNEHDPGYMRTMRIHLV